MIVGVEGNEKAEVFGQHRLKQTLFYNLKGKTNSEISYEDANLSYKDLIGTQAATV